MTAAVAAAAPAPPGEQPTFTFGLHLPRYNRRELTFQELGILHELGPAGLRRSRARGATSGPLPATTKDPGEPPTRRASRAANLPASPDPEHPAPDQPTPASRNVSVKQGS